MFGRGSYAIVRRCKSSIFFRSNPERDGGPASSQTHWCPSEAPLDAARCRCSVHWREGGSARRCASRRNGAPRTGQKRDKMGGGIPSSSGHKLSETADNGGEVRQGRGFRAGRSTAGLGGGEAVRQVEHAVSVRARFALFCETRRQILTIHKDNCKNETHILLIDSPIRNFGKHLTNAVLCCIFADKKSSTSKRN